MPVLPNPGGTCAAGQLVLGEPTWGFGYGTIGTTVVFGTQPLRNTGAACVLRLPSTVAVAAASGPFAQVSVAGTGLATSYSLPSGGSVVVGLSARWWIGVRPENGTPWPAPPCENPISDVTRIVYPVGSSQLELALPVVLKVVCTSPASISTYFSGVK